MKLYLSNIEFNKININKLQQYCISNDVIQEMYSEEGLYICKNNRGFKKVDIIDGDIKRIENYISDQDLFIDETYIYKSKVNASMLPIKHSNMNIIRYEYKLSSKSPVTLVIEECNRQFNNLYFMLTQNHGKYSMPDIDNRFTRESIQTFFELLH
jgi:hypothetical protein